jgi:hypothetical protein
MVEIHAARGLVIRDEFAKVVIRRKLSQTECCDIDSVYDILNYLRRIGVYAFFKLPEWVQMCFAIERKPLMQLCWPLPTC